jgi:hypothetical protein
MKLGILFLILVALNGNLGAKDVSRKNKIYTTRVSLLSEPVVYKGFLKETSDSSVLISGARENLENLNNRNYMQEFHFSVIDEISLKRKKSTLRGAGYGVLGGMLIASIVYGIVKEGTTKSNDPFAGIGQSIEGGVWGSAGMIAGGTVGAIAGLTIKVKIPVKGTHENFSNNKERLRKYSYDK